VKILGMVSIFCQYSHHPFKEVYASDGVE